MGKKTPNFGFEMESGYNKSTLNQNLLKLDKKLAESGGGGVEVRSDDPADPSVGDSWYNTTDDVLRVAYDDGGSVGVREVRSVFSEAGVRVVEDFEGQTMGNLQGIRLR